MFNISGFPTAIYEHKDLCVPNTRPVSIVIHGVHNGVKLVMSVLTLSTVETARIILTSSETASNQLLA